MTRTLPDHRAAPPRRAALRVLVGGTLALLIALGIGRITGSIV